MNASRRQRTLRTLVLALIVCALAQGTQGKEFPASTPQPAAEQQDFAAGRLYPSGEYLIQQEGSTVSMLPDGSVLVYGLGAVSDRQITQAARTRLLRARHEKAAQSGADATPKWWDPAKRGWRRLPAAPECAAQARYLHTATVLDDGKVLIAGGLCDVPKMGDDHRPFGAQAALSLWDSRSRRWLPAPSLQHPRIYHSASLMPDGGVIIVGGETDPGLVSSPPEPVLDSVERFAADRVEPLPPLAVARARHTATVLADGRLLVAGGFDDTGRAIAAVEMWNPATGAWQVLPSLRMARYSHSATRLADGRVMVAGGIGADGSPLSSVEIWDPARRQWLAGPSLPIPLYEHAAARLASGQVLVAGGAWLAPNFDRAPWAWSWTVGAAEWEVAAHVLPSTERERPDGITLFQQRDGSAMVFTPLHIMRWRPRGKAPDGVAPVWQSRPSLAVLPDSRVLIVGRESGDFGSGRPKAHLWDPATDRWSAAGTLHGSSWLQESTVALASGRVVHVGIDRDRNFNCEIWGADDNDWHSCGSTPLEFESKWPIQTGLLSDGRPFAIANVRETLVFDAAGKRWDKWRSEWSSEDLAYGAPIRSTRPLARILDEANGRWHEINEAAGRFWQSMASDTPSLLWDGKAANWAYVFYGHRMGHDAAFLPDGCAISAQPLALFDPASGKVAALTDPGFGIDLRQAAMRVLADGTVVVAGVAAAGAGAGFFHGKASCAGFDPASGSPGYISGGLVRDEPAASTSARTVPAEPSRQPTWQEKVMAELRPRGWLLVAAALLLAVVVMGRKVFNRAHTGSPWPTRVLVYGVALLVIIPTARSWLILSRQKSSVVEGQPESGMPCWLVGVWSSRQGNRVHRIELKDDGTYVLEPNPVVAGNSSPLTGYWSLQGDRLAWRDRSGEGPADINPMQIESETRFALTEQNGRKTVFELIRAVPSGRCRH